MNTKEDTQPKNVNIELIEITEDIINMFKNLQLSDKKMNEIQSKKVITKFIYEQLLIAQEKKEEEIKNNNLPDIMNISQNHQTNSIHDMIAGGKKLRIQGKTSKIDIDKRTEKLTVVMSGRKDNYNTTITLKNFVDIKRFFTPNMAKLLDLIFYHLNIDGDSSSTFTVVEYLDYCGRKVTIDTRKEATKEIKLYLKALFNMHLEGKSGKYTITLIQPFSKVLLKRGGIIAVNIDKDLEEALESNFIQMHKEVGRLSGTAYFMASFIYKFVRFKKDWKISLTNETLYEHSGLPRYEEVAKKDRAINQKIIEPYHKYIAEIQDTLKEKIVIWQNPFNESNWEEFKNAKVDIEIPGFKLYVNELILSKTKAIKKVITRKKINKDKKTLNNIICQ
jgi:hypothetical protein